MPSQFFGLNIAYSALTAANVGLNTTGNNISNVETKGYSRQQVQQRASDALRTFTTYGCAGAGVDTIAIERMRDEFYDVKYWDNNRTAGEYDKKQYYMKQIEDYFADDGKNIKGFTSIFNDMYKALAEVKKSAGDDTKQTQFVAAAQALTDYFNATSANLQKAQQDANSEIMIKTNQINSLAEEIATLNEQINIIEMQGSSANELRDRRTVLVDELSAIVDIETKEIPIVDANNPDRVTGANRYIITIAGGQTLVDMNDFRALECIPRKPNQKVNQSDVDGLYDIQWKDGATFGMHSPILGGELKGLLDMRDGNNGANFQGKVGNVGVVAPPDPDAGKKTVRIDVTAEDLKNLDKSTLSDSGGMINIGGQMFQFDSWSYTADTTVTPPTYAYEFVLSNTNKTEISAAKVGREASIGDSIDYQGIPYYMQQMNEWVRGFAAEFNKILQQPGAVNAAGDPGEKLFTGNNKDGTQLEFPNSVPYKGNGTVKSSDDSYYKLTASNFTITKILSEKPERLATHTGGTEGESKYDVLDDLINLKTDKSKMNFRGSSASGFLEVVWTDVSLNAQHANTFYKNSSNISKTIDTQRLSISGVDKDEEAVNLVKYQNAFTLASKMIQTLTEIYDRLILQTGV